MRWEEKMSVGHWWEGPEFDRCFQWWPSALNSRGAELQVFKAAPSSSSKWSRQEDLWTKGCAERGARATPPLYNFNLWWMIVEERSGGDKYESACPRRSSIMRRLLTFDLAGEMDLFFVRKLSLRKLECINQRGNDRGTISEEKHIKSNQCHDLIWSVLAQHFYA